MAPSQFLPSNSYQDNINARITSRDPPTSRETELVHPMYKVLRITDGEVAVHRLEIIGDPLVTRIIVEIARGILTVTRGVISQVVVGTGIFAVEAEVSEEVVEVWCRRGDEAIAEVGPLLLSPGLVPGRRRQDVEEDSIVMPIARILFARTALREDHLIRPQLIRLLYRKGAPMLRPKVDRMNSVVTLDQALKAQLLVEMQQG